MYSKTLKMECISIFRRKTLNCNSYKNNENNNRVCFYQMLYNIRVNVAICVEAQLKIIFSFTMNFMLWHIDTWIDRERDSMLQFSFWKHKMINHKKRQFVEFSKMREINYFLFYKNECDVSNGETLWSSDNVHNSNEEKSNWQCLLFSVQ